jgi:fatty-acyl-CoA synthase
MRAARNQQRARMPTVTGLLTDFTDAKPDALAIYYGGSTVTAAELQALSQRLAAGLRSLGVIEGDRIAVWLPNCPAYLALCFACARIGAIVVAVNTRFRSAEIEDIVGRSGAKVLVLWPGFKQIAFLDILAGIDPAKLIELETVIVYDEGGGSDGGPSLPFATVSYDELSGSEPLNTDLATDDTPCSIFTTSGTTKAPKFVLHRQYSIARHAQLVAPAMGYDRPGTVMLQALPLCGVFGYAQAMATVAARAPMVMLPAFDAGEAADLINRHQVTDFNATDDMIDRLLGATDPAVETPFPSLRAVGYAAFNQALEDIIERADAKGITLFGLYGMSEVQALFARQPADAPIDMRRRAGGLFTAPDAEARVRDPETGKILPRGEAGELELKGPSLMVGYFRNAEATAEALHSDGFLRTGDLGYVVPREEGDGFVFLSRMGDVLRLGGFLVAPAEIESYLQEHHTVDGAQVVAVSTEKGVRPVAFVVADKGTTIDEDALIAHCKAGLASFKVPVRIQALDEFPATVSANGVKIQRHKLREMAAALVATA